MISTAHPAKDTVSVGARGLGGMSYFLHVFWDTEIFVLPFFIYTQPETARTLLKYRYRNLAGRAAEGGAHGVPRRAVPVGVRGQGRRDDAALRLRPERRAGAHPLRPHGAPHLGRRRLGRRGSTGRRPATTRSWRAWASRCCWRRRGSGSRAPRATDEGRYHVRVVVGPDEYHEGVDDNAYTNVLARWNIKRALEALAWLESVDEDYAEELKKRLELTRHGALRLAQGDRRLRGRLRPGDAALRAVRRVLRHGRRADREAPAAADGRRPAARPRRDAGQQGGQAGGRRHALPRARRRDRRGDDARQLRLLRAHHLPRQLAEPGHPRRRGGAAPRRARGDGVLQDGGGDRPRRQHGQRGRRPAHGHHGRPVAGGRDGLLRHHAPRRGAAAGPAAAGGLEAGPPAAALPRRAPAASTSAPERTASTWV